MPTLDTTVAKRISDYVVGRDRVMGKDVTVKRVTVKHGSSITIDPLGVPVMTDDAGAWTIFRNTYDIAGQDPVTSLGGAKVGIIVGSSEGYGRNQETVTLTTSGVECHVLFGVFGNAVIKSANLDWTAGGNVTTADSTEKLEFLAQLSNQGVADQTVATVVDPTYVP